MSIQKEFLETQSAVQVQLDHMLDHASVSTTLLANNDLVEYHAGQAIDPSKDLWTQQTFTNHYCQRMNRNAKLDKYKNYFSRFNGKVARGAGYITMGAIALSTGAAYIAGPGALASSLGLLGGATGMVAMISGELAVAPDMIESVDSYFQVKQGFLIGLNSESEVRDANHRLGRNLFDAGTLVLATAPIVGESVYARQAIQAEKLGQVAKVETLAKRVTAFKNTNVPISLFFMGIAAPDAIRYQDPTGVIFPSLFLIHGTAMNRAVQGAVSK